MRLFHVSRFLRLLHFYLSSRIWSLVFPDLCHLQISCPKLLGLPAEGLFVISCRAVFLSDLDPQEIPSDRGKTCIPHQTCTCIPMPLISRPLLPLVYVFFLGGSGGNATVPSSRVLSLPACSACFCSTFFRMGTPELTRGFCGPPFAGQSCICLGDLWASCSRTFGPSLTLLGTPCIEKPSLFSCCAASLPYSWNIRPRRRCGSLRRKWHKSNLMGRSCRFALCVYLSSEVPPR